MVKNRISQLITRLLPCIAVLLLVTASPAFAVDEDKCAERGDYYNDHRDDCEKKFCKNDGYEASHLKNCQRIEYKINYDPSPDSNECACRNKVRNINIGLFRFLKWTETAGNASNGFNPAIKVTYKTQGLFVNWYEISGDHSATLKHGECEWLYGLRFCARNAWPVGIKVMSENQDLTKAAHGYEGLYADDSCYRDKGGTCNRPKKEQVRLCAYEDSMDGMDTDSKKNPFHKQYPRVNDLGKAVADGAASGTALGGILGTFVPGVGTVIGAIVGAIFGPLIALIMSTYNHVVIMSLGCVDLPLLPPPPPYCATLVNPPPRPQVTNVSSLQAGSTQVTSPNELQKAQAQQKPLEMFAGPYPEKAYKEASNVKNADHWRYQDNIDWFYPKIGIILGDYSYKADTDGDASREVLDQDIFKSAVIRVDPYNPANNKVTLEIPIDGDAGSTVKYTVAAEALDDKVCAYITSAPYIVDQPELIDCVDRPTTYPKKNGTYASAPPLPQAFQPTDGSSNAENPKLYVWLRDDPRLSANVDYNSYPTLDNAGKAAFFNTIRTTAAFVPLNGCDTPDPLNPANTPMGKPANMSHRLFGYPYCIARQDNNRNGVLEYNERDLCVNNLPTDNLGKVMEYMIPTATAYNVIIADFNPQLAIEGECSKSLDAGISDPSDGSVTYNIVDNDNCKYDDKGADVGMRRFAPDNLRGELVVERDGKQVLLRRNVAPSKVIVKPYADYTGGAAPVPIYNECRYELQSDNQLKEMCEPSGRFRYPPDMYRGESIRSKVPLETTDALSYCVKVADIMCPLEYPTDGNVDHWNRSPAYPEDQAASMPGTGKCKEGYGVVAPKALPTGGFPPFITIDPDVSPERKCVATQGNANNFLGSWGDVIPGKECQPIQCSAMELTMNQVKTGSNCNAKCDYKCNTSNTSAGTNNVTLSCSKVSCTGPGVNPADNMNVAMDCNRYGQWANFRPQTFCNAQ